jgi:CSLREA domain-containing protein
MPRHAPQTRSAHRWLIALTGWLAFGVAPLHAQATYTVNSTGDGADANTGDGVCDDGGGNCTLRAAIGQANATPGLDNIHFSIAGTGPHTIQPASSLPRVTDPVVIDGYTQPGSSANTNPRSQGTNAVLMIVLNATNHMSGEGLEIDAGNSTVRGLRIEAAPDYVIGLRTNGGNTIEGNVLLPGSAAANGVYILTADNTIGGTSPAARNVIGGSLTGISIFSGTGNVVQGNLIGTTAAGTAALANQIGIRILVSASQNTIGGTAVGAGNVISGNLYGIRIEGDENTVAGNLIGTDVSGTLPLGNDVGVTIFGMSNTVGGVGAGNVISGNSLNGVQIEGGSGNTVAGNLIGTDASGVQPLGNGTPDDFESGVFIRTTGQGNVVEHNTVAFNRGHGVQVDGGTGIRVSENTIFSNTGLGISLGSGGVTPNDVGDADAGANNLQNFPVVTLAYQSGGTAVEGTLNSAATTTFTLEFFASGACDPSDHGEGAVFLGSAMVTTDGAGDASFTETLATAATAGEVVTATATDPSGNTSEFSPCVRVNTVPTFVVTAADDADDGVCSDGHCSVREAITAANARLGADLIHFDIPGTGPHTIQPASSLPRVNDPVVIDGYTQPGSSANSNPPGQGTNAALMIVLDAANTGNGLGLLIGAPGSTVRGLRIAGAPGSAVYLGEGSDGSTIEGNLLLPGSRGYGVFIETSGNTIGGTAPAARNVIGGGRTGVRIEGGGNVIQGNLIGTDAAGTGANGNSESGIRLTGPANTVGGTSPGAGNVISANGHGIDLATSAASVDQTVIQGNLIGTDVTGTAALGNSARGVSIEGGSDHTIEGNVIAGNSGDGIGLSGTAGAVVMANIIGVDVTRRNTIANGLSGIRISGGTTESRIGGTAAGAGNVIAYSGANGVTVVDGTGHAILGNAIYGNAGLGIDLGDDGMTANDAGDGDAGPNNGQNFPSIAFAFTGSAELGGTFGSVANATFTLEFFASSECDDSGNGEGDRVLGSIMVTTDGNGDAAFTASLTGPASSGDQVTATATDDEGNTSEFSPCVTGVGYSLGAISPDALVIRGQEASYDVLVQSFDGTFDRDITLSCADLPAGASCAFTPATVQPGATSARSALVVSTNLDTPTGANDFFVVGTFGMIRRTDVVTVTVTDFTVAASPDTVAVTGGQNAAFIVTVGPDGPSFGDPVSLSCAGLPGGASCSFAPAAVTPGAESATSTLTVSTVSLSAASAVAYSGAPRFPLALSCLMVVAVLASLRGRPLRIRLVLGMLLLVALADVACGGDPVEPTRQPVTTAFTITGTSGDVQRSTSAAVRVE